MKNSEEVGRIRTAAMTKHADAHDMCVKNALKRWREGRLENDEEPIGEPAHNIKWPELEMLTIEWHGAGIKENISIERARLAGLHAGQVRVKLISPLAEEDDQAHHKTICGNRGSAADLAQHGCPNALPERDRAPLQFLAKQVLYAHTAHVALNGKHRKVGFCAS